MDVVEEDQSVPISVDDDQISDINDTVQRENEMIVRNENGMIVRYPYDDGDDAEDSDYIEEDTDSDDEEYDRKYEINFERGVRLYHKYRSKKKKTMIVDPDSDEDTFVDDVPRRERRLLSKQKIPSRTSNAENPYTLFVVTTYRDEAIEHGYIHAFVHNLDNHFFYYHPSWKKFMETERGIKTIIDNLSNEDITPSMDLVFRIFRFSLDEIKVIIVGQDPYPGVGDADGLAFSSSSHKMPASLRNIQKEILSKKQYPKAEMTGGSDLTCWAKQGVLLINMYMSNIPGHTDKPHRTIWGDFAKQVVDFVAKRRNTETYLKFNPVTEKNVKTKKQAIIMLWGAVAQNGMNTITKVHRLESAHPSPISAKNGFFGCNHFKQANDILKEYGDDEIDWSF